MPCIFPPTRASIRIQRNCFGSGPEKMLSQVILSVSVILESLLLFRGFRQRLTSRYPAFYCYIAFVLFQDPVCYFVDRWMHPLYTPVYWTAEFLCVLLSCGIIFEIYRVGLAAYPGTARMARVALGLVFGIALVKALISDPRLWTEAPATTVESTLRTVQGVAIVAMVALFLFYSVPLGKNLRGIVMGYGLFVCWSVICLTFASLTGGKVHVLLAYLYPASYLLFLSICLRYLWSYQADKSPEPADPADRGYGRVADATLRRLQDARGYLGKTVGS